MAPNRRRTDLGDAASAALPWLWLEVKRRGWSDADLAHHLTTDTARVARIIYGDGKPGRKLANRFLRVLGLPLELWDEPCPVAVRPHEECSATALPATGTD